MFFLANHSRYWWIRLVGCADWQKEKVCLWIRTDLRTDIQHHVSLGVSSSVPQLGIVFRWWCIYEKLFIENWSTNLVEDGNQEEED